MTTKIPVELSSTPGIVDGSNATAITIDSSEQVGIGTASPAQTLHTSGTGVQRIQIDATDNNAAGAGLYMKVLNSGSLVGNATIRVDNVGNIDFFNGTSSESKKWTIGTNGHLKPAVDGYGINFEASKGAGETSTTLDDYEEGTFQPTPSISGATGAIAFKSAADTLSYTKIGDLVHIQGYLQIDSNTVNGGRLNLGNLPFTSVDSAEASGYSLFTAQLSSGSGSQASGFFASIGEGLTLLQIQTYTGVGTSNNSAVTMVADSFLFIQGQYKAA